jgi:hypothetical protein
MDAAGHDPARSHRKRNEDRFAKCEAGTLRLPGLQLRAALLPEGWSLVFGGRSVAKERATPRTRVAEITVPAKLAPWDEVRTRLNNLLRGWATYFNYGTRLMAYRAADHYVHEAVRGFLTRRHKVPSRRTRRFSDPVVFGTLRVLRLRRMHKYHRTEARSIAPARNESLQPQAPRRWWRGFSVSNAEVTDQLAAVNTICARPAATFRPVMPSRLKGCKEMVLVEPPISTFAAPPAPTAAPPVTPP